MVTGFDMQLEKGRSNRDYKVRRVTAICKTLVKTCTRVAAHVSGQTLNMPMTK